MRVSKWAKFSNALGPTRICNLTLGVGEKGGWAMLSSQASHLPTGPVTFRGSLLAHPNVGQKTFQHSLMDKTHWGRRLYSPIYRRGKLRIKAKKALVLLLWSLIWIESFILKGYFGEFPGGPVVRTPHSHCRGPRFDLWSLVAELRSHKPGSAAKKKKRLLCGKSWRQWLAPGRRSLLLLLCYYYSPRLL